MSLAALLGRPSVAPPWSARYAVFLVSNTYTRSIPLHSECDLGCHTTHTGPDAHHADLLGLRHDGPRYTTACAGLGWSKRHTLRPSWLDRKRDRDTIHRMPLGVLHPHDQLGSQRQSCDACVAP